MSTNSRAEPRFAGHVALVTGAGSGVGAATARAFAAEGARVIVADIHVARAEAVAAGIVADGAEALAVEVDVSNEQQVEHAVARAIDAFGSISVLHNNAADLSPEWHGRDGHIHDLDEAVWDRAVQVNSKGTMLFTKHVVPHMVATGSGAIVNMSSVVAFSGDLRAAAYASTKAAIVALTRHTATMYGMHGIRCNAVAPGLILTPGSAAYITEQDANMLAYERLGCPAAEPEDIANAVLFLASDGARCITGHTLVVDSGILAHRPLYLVAAAPADVLAAGPSERWLDDRRYK